MCEEMSVHTCDAGCQLCAEVCTLQMQTSYRQRLSSSQSQKICFDSEMSFYTENLNSRTSKDSKDAFLHCGDAEGCTSPTTLREDINEGRHE